ncbi:MAG TPA: NADH-quinone oxidoreductase subunit L, partial [Candidatus Korarchaeota archaeon]|nr:NADH-quinone oxidoreductase subunit L [Candidatus Korarchaeota archaeon]
MELAQVLAVATWMIPYAGALASLLLSRLGRVRDVLAATWLGISAICTTFLLREVLTSSEGVVAWSAPWISELGVNVGVYVDTLSAFMGLVVAWLSFLIGVYSLKYMEGDPGLTRYWFFFDFFVGSMLLLILADNLLLMFLGWEGTGLASYSLIGHWYTDEEERWVGDPGRAALGIPMYFPPSHSGLRALTFTRLGDVGFLAGIGVLYALTGTFSIPEIAEHTGEWAGWLASKGLLLPFLIAFSLGALAKSAQFPFHEWLVTAMTGPTSVSALIHAATMVKAGVYFLLRFGPIFKLAYHELAHSMPVASSTIETYFAIIATIGGFTAFFMATQALVARELKLILAFSTASQLGYMVMVLGCSGLVEEFANGLVAGFTHFMSHAIFKAALFLGAGAVIHAVHSKYVDEMGGLSSHMKITFYSMLIAALSLSGLPPLMGFWSKDFVVEIAKESGLKIVLALGVITAGMTAFYSTRLITRTFLGVKSHHVEHLEEEHKLHEAHPIMAYIYLILAALSLLLGLAWPWIGPKFFEAVSEHILALEEVPAHFEIHLDPTLLAMSLGMVLSGIGVGVFSYLTNPGKALTSAISRSRPLSAVQSMLYDRWYINSIYYRIVVGGFAWASRLGSKWFDTLVVDGFYHKFIPGIMSLASRLG